MFECWTVGEQTDTLKHLLFKFSLTFSDKHLLYRLKRHSPSKRGAPFNDVLNWIKLEPQYTSPNENFEYNYSLLVSDKYKAEYPII